MARGVSEVNANVFPLSRLNEQKNSCGKQQSGRSNEREQIEDGVAVGLERVAVTELNPIIG